MHKEIEIKKGDLFINTIDGMTVIKYCFRCPVTENLIFEDISTNITDIRRCIYHYCYSCKYYNKCYNINNMYSFDDETFYYFLKTREVVKFNRLNAILYLKEEYRKKVYRYLEQNQTG